MSRYRYRIRETKLLSVEVEVDDGSDPEDPSSFSQESMRAAIAKFRAQRITRTVEVVNVEKLGVDYVPSDEG